MAQTMMLIAGRSAKQGVSLNEGKLKENYQNVTSTVEMNMDDMSRLGLEDGDKVSLRSQIGQIVASIKGKKVDDLPDGLLFIPYGPLSSQLTGGDTAATGMPMSKHYIVEVEKHTS